MKIHKKIMERDIKIIKTILAVFLIVLVSYLLKLFANWFIPLTFAVFLTLVILPLLKKAKKYKIPYFVTLIIIFVIISLSVKGISWIIQDTALQIASESAKITDQFNHKMKPILDQSEEMFGSEIFAEKNNLIEDNIKGILTSKGFGNVVKFSLGTAQKFLQSFFMILFFFLLILGSAVHYEEKLTKFSKKGNEKNSILIFEGVMSSLNMFLRVKTIMSLCTGIGFTIIAYIFGVDFPLFWGFFTFIVNYVQLVGSIVSTITVAAFGFLQIETMGGFAIFAMSLALIQVLFGSILEPIFMGKSFSINTVFIIISLFIWGYLWGISGMILSIPIIASIKIFLDNSKNYQELGAFLGARKNLMAEKLKDNKFIKIPKS